MIFLIGVRCNMGYGDAEAVLVKMIEVIRGLVAVANEKKTKTTKFEIKPSAQHASP